LSENSFVLYDESEATVFLTVLEQYLKLFNWVRDLDFVNISVGKLIILIRNEILFQMIIDSERAHMNLFEFKDIFVRTIVNTSGIFNSTIRGNLNLNWLSFTISESYDQFGSWSRNGNITKLSEFT